MYLHINASDFHCASLISEPRLEDPAFQEQISLYSGRLHGLVTLCPECFFNFPSRYLFAIDFVDIFSLRSNLRPVFALHSQATRLSGKKSRTHAHVHAARRDSNPLWFMPTPLGASKHSKKPHLGTRCARAC